MDDGKSTPASVIARSRFSACTFLEHSTSIWPDLSFLTSFIIPATLEIPFCIANGDSLDSGISGSKDSRRINLVKCQL